MKPQRVINAVLLCVAFAGLFYSVRESQRTQVLIDDAGRLHQLVGELSVEHADKVYVRAIPMESRLNFAWWVYLPVGYKPSCKATVGEALGSPQMQGHSGPCLPLNEPSQFVLRLKLRGTPRSYSYRYQGEHPHLSGGVSSRANGEIFVGVALSQPERLTIRQVGVEETMEFTKDDDIVLLEIDPLNPKRKGRYTTCEFRLASEKHLFALRNKKEKDGWDGRLKDEVDDAK